MKKGPLKEFLEGLAGCGTWIFGLFLLMVFICIPGAVIKFNEHGWLFSYILPILVIVLLISIIIFYNRSQNAKMESERAINECNIKKRRLEDFYKMKLNDLGKEYQQRKNSLEREYQQRKIELDFKEEKMHLIMDAYEPFTYSASLASDMETYIFDKGKEYLIEKSHPAYTAAETVSELKNKAKKAISDYKQMLYKYEFLISSFPELKQYVEDEEALQSLNKEESYTDFKDNYDYSRDYLSDNEWKSLTENERNQLALDRYKKKPKSNWTVGMLYEMYIGYLLRDEMTVIQFGIINGLDDLGRDIIAKTKLEDGSTGIYIIQCKNWATDKVIHENVVCQLFGTAMEYRLKHNCDSKGESVLPVLCTTTKLSDTAKMFAERLNVDICVKPLGDFPMIKCNINNGQKIYHLPFDQQYWKTKIEKEGEFYAWTIDEATKKGFRRAFRHKSKK